MNLFSPVASPHSSRRSIFDTRLGPGLDAPKSCPSGLSRLGGSGFRSGAVRVTTCYEELLHFRCEISGGGGRVEGSQGLSYEFGDLE